MQALPVILVFLSAVLHAFVQVLLKKSGDKIAFSYLQILAGTIILFPIFLAFFSIDEFRTDMIWLIVLNGILETVYLFLIAKAYTIEDVSIVYPLARSTPFFALIFSIFFLNEALSAISIFGILLTIVGIYLLPLEKFSLVGVKKYFSIVKGRPGAKIAILAAFVVASYSFFAKISLEYFNPIVFSYLFGIPILVFLTPYVLTRKKQELRTEWKKNKKSIVLYAVLIFISFVLLLWALQLDTLAEIISLRQISIVIGVLFGWQILNERRLLTRLTGATIITIGAIIISIF